MNVMQRVVTALDRNLALVFLAPGFILLLLILAYPVISNFVLSATDANLLRHGSRWIGGENFRAIVEDPRFWNAAKNSIEWTAGSVTLQLGLGLVGALMMDRVTWGRGVLRSLMLIPYAFPPITMGLLWRWMLNDQYGIYNSMLVGLRLSNGPINWFADGRLAMWTAILVNVWFGYPLMLLTILAGLQTIPRDFYEVAEIEGANYTQTLRYVILPNVAKIMGIMVVLRTMWVFNNFDTVFLLTGGGPLFDTETLPIYIYRTGWQIYQIGRTAALGVLLFGFLGLLMLLYFRTLRLENGER